MAIHPETKRVVDYPNTIGKSIALKQYNWNQLDQTEEVFKAPHVINLAQKIDSELPSVEEREYINSMLRDRLSCLKDNLQYASNEELIEFKETWEEEIKIINSIFNSKL